MSPGRYAFVEDDTRPEGRAVPRGESDRPTVRTPVASRTRAELTERLKEVDAQLRSLRTARDSILRAIEELDRG